MTPQQKPEFLALMTGVCELYGKNGSPQFLALYWQMLERYELSDIQRAMHQHAMNADTGQFMPKPADVVSYIDGGSQTRAAKAWAKVDYALRCVGGGDSVVFDDAIIHSALEGLGSWPELCATPTDELTFLQGRFEKRYQAMAFNPPDVWVKKLVGRYETELLNAGLKADPPVPVGNYEQCKLVNKGGVAPGEMISLPNAAQVAIRQIQNAVNAAPNDQQRAA